MLLPQWQTNTPTRGGSSETSRSGGYSGSVMAVNLAAARSLPSVAAAADHADVLRRQGLEDVGHGLGALGHQRVGRVAADSRVEVAEVLGPLGQRRLAQRRVALDADEVLPQGAEGNAGADLRHAVDE